MAYIRYNPNEPGDKEKAYGEFFLSLFFVLGSVGIVIYYVFSLVSLFKGDYSEHMFYSVGLLIVMAIIDYFFIFSKFNGKNKKEAAKCFFLIFFGGAIDLAGVIAIIVTIYNLCHHGTGTVLLISSVLVVLIVTFVVIMIYRIIKGYGLPSINLVTDKNISAAIEQSSIEKNKSAVRSVGQSASQSIQESNCVFCHKCGKKLLDDSVFCSSCGSKLK